MIELKRRLRQASVSYARTVIRCPSSKDDVKVSSNKVGMGHHDVGQVYGGIQQKLEL